MSTYGHFCPVARASEIFAERWTPLIVREIVGGRHHFGEIHEALQRISPSVLGKRLRELEDAGVIERHRNPMGRGSTYHLTDAGRELEPIIEALGSWGQRWLELRHEHLDAHALMWQLSRRIPGVALPPERTVIRFELRGTARPFWLILERPHTELCYDAPAVEDDLVVRADLEALTRVFLGQLTLASALRAGLVSVEGTTTLARLLPRWIVPSHFARYAQTVRYDADAATYRVLSR